MASAPMLMYRMTFLHLQELPGPGVGFEPLDIGVQDGSYDHLFRMFRVNAVQSGRVCRLATRNEQA